ncbi:WecB/TagA/CpsF family glycosyltransferase [Alkaliphilus hydrothermalis]|uniref:N-acetylglucosaminyldiphosphoundecaprenol N-acetyl-beta-D-mannosaminyltransferase n=1 Tax=Alkaliphilus hydrothermalis TaxID=1482730 RepID=A0ABS2NN25_9FIRM|nr:WecB/TagA/CpsF family glycosyltransferase [Alkaliphilus hydrothermalis]MBM7614256.1 N-acetylglucosaminyldiphosphoundecaprenol N-acetyl-beta-D-mannosaminyltransferase [Alkaliphilus hydrothermalis]
MSKKAEILNVPIDAITMKEAIRKVTSFVEGDTLKKVYTPNPEIVMLAQENKELDRIVKEADLVVPDGIGLIIASKLKSKGLIERVTGVDLMHHLLLYCASNHKSIYIMGGKPGVAEMAVTNIAAKYKGINIAGFRDGYYKQEETESVINDINQSGADVLFVCLGAPRQEIWIDKHKDQLKCKVAMGVGGSVDIHAGTAKRAPEIYQKMGMEWFYRLAKEPWRFKRMLVLPKFLIKFILKG